MSKKVTSKAALKQLLKEVQRTAVKLEKLREKIEEKTANWSEKVKEMEYRLRWKAGEYEKALREEQEKAGSGKKG